MHHTIILPDLGQTTNEARIATWLKRVGDHVSRGEPLLAVETDKVNMEVEAFESGYLREVLIPEGELASALMPIAVLTDTVDEPYELKPREQAPAVVAAPEPKRAKAGSGNKAAAAPAARALARQLGVNLATITGTGSNGLITSADIRKAAERDVPNLRAMQAMAATVVQSKREIPHFYVVADLQMDHASAWRSVRNQEPGSSRVSFNDVFVRCATSALAESPRMRTLYAGGEFKLQENAGVLIVKEQDGILTYLSGATAPTLAISNLGMYGVKQFTAIIPPQCTAVLAIGAVRHDPVFQDGDFQARQVCTVTLSCDHRVVDGVAAARFLELMQRHLNSL